MTKPNDFKFQINLDGHTVAYDVCNDGYGEYFDIFVFDPSGTNVTYDLHAYDLEKFEDFAKGDYYNHADEMTAAYLYDI